MIIIVAWVLTIGFAAVGLACLVLVIARWSSVGQHVSDWWAKVPAKTAKIVSAAATFGSGVVAADPATVAADKTAWYLATGFGAAAALVWELVESLVDSRVKAADKAGKDELGRVRAECQDELCRVQAEGEARATLLAVLTKNTEQSVKMLSHLVKKHPKGKPLVLFRKCFGEDDYLRGLLEAVAEYLRSRIADADRPEANFRLVLFVENNGGMEPVPFVAVDVRNGAYDAFPSFEQRPDAFRFDSPAPQPHAVQCAEQKRHLLVEDCQTAPPTAFRYLNDKQPSYLKSLFALYLGEVYWSGRRLRRASLVVTTNVTGYFREADRKSWESAWPVFILRIRLALVMRTLLNSPPPETRRATADP